MKKSQKQIEEYKEKLYKEGWTPKQIECIGFCPGCGSFSLEDCEKDCPENAKALLYIQSIFKNNIISPRAQEHTWS